MSLRADPDNSTLKVYILYGCARADPMSVDLHALAKRVHATYAQKNADEVPPDSMSVTASCRHADIKLFGSSLTLKREEGSYSIKGFRASVLFRIAGDAGASR